MEDYKTSKKYYRLLLFWVGIIATLAYRIIIVLNHYSQFYVEVAWYIGTIGFVWYFAHRFRVENKREKLIEEKRLGAKILNKEELTESDREALFYVLNGLKSSKARWNYIFIFLLSAMALLYDIVNKIIN